MPKLKNKKCKAITNSGKKCNKEAYQNTYYCKAHQNKIHFEKGIHSTEKYVWYKSKSVRFTILFFILGSVLAIYLFMKGPSVANQELILQKQDVNEQKLDTLNYTILKLSEYFEKPKNPDEYETENRKFEEKNRKLNELMQKLESKNQITADSLLKLKQEFFRYKKELETELAQLKLSLKEIRKVNDVNFNEIFKYGYATFVIGAEKKVNTVEIFKGIEKKVEIDWKSMDASISKNSIVIKNVNLTLLEKQFTLNNSTIQFNRNFNAVGKLIPRSLITDYSIELVYTILSDNSKGITFILGFTPYNDKNNRKKTNSV